MNRGLLAALLLLLLIQVTAGGFSGSKSKSKGEQPEVHTSEFKYGDIIGFQREKGCIVKYKHFGIFIDKKRFERQGDKDDLYHIAGPKRCVFAKMKDVAKSSTPVRDNYLDALAKVLPEVNIGTEVQITQRIEEIIQNCPTYDPFHRNCEHLATYIRYGVSISLQLKQTAEGKCHARENGWSREEEREILKLKLKQATFGDTEPDAAAYDCMWSEDEPEQAAPGQAAPARAKPEQAKPEQAKPARAAG